MDAPAPAALCRDPALGAWLLSRHADVAAALREPRLVPDDAGGGGAAAAHAAMAHAAMAHAAAREAAVRVAGPARTAAWRDGMETSARALAGALPADRPVDLARDLAAPWSLALAVDAVRAPPADAGRLAGLARTLFLAAAGATGAALPPPALAAAAALARALPDAADVQAFVALSQTLPRALAGVWHALLGDPGAADRLRARPALLPRAVDELLRRGGPSRAVFRRALADVVVGGAPIAAGERVVLLLAAANHDPARFPEPDRLDLARDAAGHLAFGRGAHACPGAPAIRSAVAVATAALLDAATAIEPAGEPTWDGGFAILGPASLPAVLRRPVAGAPVAR